ncbi:hypothetical protein [Hymenobacter nivis]|uniref:Uncharacterized protein n=1 Tax=Hymenobacter nivis TaxID=1850093 RepID=A0A502GV11_9BACT|nr:hypothetical protein [Hymenobacter nivis]TPG66069.1 hypothetical protein EAH73_11915 [Hymenobacter nivis]
MVSYAQPEAPTLPAPVGLDAEIQRLQLLLAAELSWLQVSYGKAYRGSRKAPGGKVQYFPEVYAGKREYRDVLPNDNVAAQSFFYPTGPQANPNREPLPGTLSLQQPVDLIVWGNLEAIDPTKTWRYEAELVVDVVRVLNEDGRARIVRVVTQAEEVFRGFSPELLPAHQLRQPWAGFRVQMELNVGNVLC